jgi:hypothetical protein
MIKLPSYGSSILAGAVCTPVLILGVDCIEKNSKNQFLEFTWFIIWFFLPVLISTVDLGEIRKRWQKGHTLYMLIRSWQFKAEDFRRFYIPAFKRMLVYFVSACISTLFLKLIGIDFG